MLPFVLIEQIPIPMDFLLYFMHDAGVIVRNLLAGSTFCAQQGQIAYPTISPYYGSLYVAYGGQPMVSSYYKV